MIEKGQPASFNSIILGLLLGIFLPILVFILYYFSRFGEIPFFDYVDRLIQAGKLVHVVSLSVFPNLGMFFLFVRTNRLRAARGVLTATVLCGILVFVLKLS